jgi:poly(3-hydroxybutyrate) depolymerase
LYLLAGTTDHITPPDQVFAIAKHVSTPASQIRLDVTPGGHLGLFMGHQALREHWPALLAKVFEQSV